MSSYLNLSSGVHQYKYVVDGTWIHDEKKDTMENEMGSKNNVIRIEDYPGTTEDKQEAASVPTVLENCPPIAVVASYDSANDNKDLKNDSPVVDDMAVEDPNCEPSSTEPDADKDSQSETDVEQKSLGVDLSPTLPPNNQAEDNPVQPPNADFVTSHAACSIDSNNEPPCSTVNEELQSEPPPAELISNHQKEPESEKSPEGEGEVAKAETVVPADKTPEDPSSDDMLSAQKINNSWCCVS